MKDTTMTTALLSDDDLSAEASLLGSHDLGRLHARLEGAIRRRQIASALVAGAAALAVAGGAAHLASRAWTPAPPPPPASPVVVHLDAAPAAPCPVPSVAAPAPAPAPPPSRTTRAPPRVIVERVVAPAAPVVPLLQDDDERAPLEGSRLRAQLRIYDEGTRALVGDPERALARARHLRERYPNGPLDVDAALLAVKALRALGRLDEAREALRDAEAHPLADEKRAVLAELRALLAAVDVEAPSRVLASVPDAPATPTPTPRDDEVAEEQRPSRVIGVVRP